MLEAKAISKLIPLNTHYYKKVCIIFFLLILSIFSVLISISSGAVPIAFKDILKVLFSDDGSIYRVIIYDFRLPRTLVALLVGISLSLSGCILQGVMRNSMASPGTLGVISGASFVGYLTLVAFPHLYYLLPIGSIIGGFVTTLLIYSLAYTKGVSPVKMILSGVAVSALFGAFNDIIRTFFTERVENVQGFLIGGLAGSTWKEFNMIVFFTVAGLIACCFIANHMNILMLGDETANSLGLRVERFRFFLIIISSLMTGSAVAVAGLIGFVGLIVPHIARMLIGSDYRFLFPASIFLSITFMTLCDSIGRIIILPAEMPVGVIMSFIGAPFFLYLLRTKLA